VDTAQIYGNEAEVGRAVSKFEAATGERVWITTKASTVRARQLGRRG
jgi:diketogulonate reductase-like aldo/keto reductase